MNKRSKYIISVICFLVLAALACKFGPFFFGTDEQYEAWEREQSYNIAFGEGERMRPNPLPTTGPQPTTGATATRPPRVTVAVEEKNSGFCRWELFEATYPSNSTSNPNMIISARTRDVATDLTYSISGCPEQMFSTYHGWTTQYHFVPGDVHELQVEFSWQNHGTPDCTNLIAGGVTSLTVGNISLRVENMSINVKTNPEGELSDSTTWTVPQGEVGDTFTIVAHASTGSYGTNARYHYKYTCD